MQRSLFEDEYEALLELAVVGPARSDRFEHPSVTLDTERRLEEAGAITSHRDSFGERVWTINAEGRRLLRAESRFRSNGLRLVDD